MNTIDTIEDLIELLDRNPQWLDALQSRILTRELIELPARFAESVERNDRFHEEVSRFIAATDRRFDLLEAKTDDLAAKTGHLETKTDDLAAKTGHLEAKTDDLAVKTDHLAVKTDRILDDLGILKGAHARNAAVEEASTIARDLGLRRTKTLTRDDLWYLTDRADTTAIASADLRSFRRADLIMEATDASGETCYIAVEISFTANGRDTTRALRNADFLTRFTGRSAYAVVSGLRRDDRIRDSIDSGAVYWHQLDPEIMEAE